MADGRTNNGGKRENAGRKSKAEELGLNALLDRVWTVQHREQVLKALHRKAKTGNEKAAALLLAYAYGKPPDRVQHENPDGTALLAPVAEALTKIYSAPTKPTD